MVHSLWSLFFLNHLPIYKYPDFSSTFYCKLLLFISAAEELFISAAEELCLQCILNLYHLSYRDVYICSHVSSTQQNIKHLSHSLYYIYFVYSMYGSELMHMPLHGFWRNVADGSNYLETLSCFSFFFFFFLQERDYSRSWFVCRFSFAFQRVS